MNYNVLFVTAEADPLIKVGGLADVSAGLPAALRERGNDVRLLMPAYGGLRGVDVNSLETVARFTRRDHCLRALPADHSMPPVWLLDTPAFRRRIHPYHASDGRNWDDDAEVYAELAQVAARIADDDVGLDWRADIVHANEWHTGLVPVELLRRRVRAASVFTIHNIAYQGIFPIPVATRLGLPAWLLQPEALEFYGSISFMKGGVVFSDRLTAVSPGYADEICTPEYGERLDGLLRSRRHVLTGVLNGIDMERWDPANDAAVAAHFDVNDMKGRKVAKQALHEELGLAKDGKPLLVFVGRLVSQKGIDLLLGALPQLMRMRLRIAVLGSGEAMLEQALKEAAASYPGQFAVHIGYSDALSRRFYAGGDMLLMPSRFEPCGLTQMYAMRYGCLPVAHAVGGLRDSITDATPGTVKNGKATGFLFESATVDAMLEGITRACARYDDAAAWSAMMQAAMAQDFSWRTSARRYEEIYSSALTIAGH